VRFEPTSISGCLRIEVEAHEDNRGLFARTWCAREFEAAGLPVGLAQCSLSRNPRKGTLRGMHYQRPPSREGKLVRATRGAVHDIIVDLRPGADSFLTHVAVELSADNLTAVFIPPGCAHGFQTLEDDTDVFYQMTDFYAPDLGEGIRWNDPRLGIEWPLPDPIMNDRDRSYPDVNEGVLAGFDWG
jgi:dTDP-4-dehydrorhamnose 3,5-epimerase